MYQVSILPDAVHDLDQLDPPVAKRIIKRLEWLGKNFENITPEALSGEWARFLKFRVGDYRVLYKAHHAERVIAVHYIQHRREVYRER